VGGPGMERFLSVIKPGGALFLVNPVGFEGRDEAAKRGIRVSSTQVRSNGARGNRVGELLALQWKAINWDAKTISFSKGFWRGRLQESTKTGQDHVRHISKTLERVLADHLQISKTLDPMILFSVDPMKMPGRMIRMTWEGKCSIPLSTCSMRCSFRAFDPARTSLKLSQMPFRVFCWQQRV